MVFSFRAAVGIVPTSFVLLRHGLLSNVSLIAVHGIIIDQIVVVQELLGVLTLFGVLLI